MGTKITAYSDAHNLSVREAIEHAHEAGLTLCSYTGPTATAKQGLTVDEAHEIARVDPSLLFVTTTTTAAEYAAANQCVIVWYVSQAEPAGVNIALFDDAEPLIDLSAVRGVVFPGGAWHWDGEGEPRAFGSMVLALSLCSNPTEYARQREDYDESI